MVIPSGDSAIFEVQFLPAVELARTDDREADVAENARRLDAILAPIIHAHIDQWYFALDFEFDELAVAQKGRVDNWCW